MLKNAFNNLSTNCTISQDTSLQTASSTESAKNIHHSKMLKPKRWTGSSALWCLHGVCMIHLLHLAVPVWAPSLISGQVSQEAFPVLPADVKQVHHVMVLVPQYAGQEERGPLGAPCSATPPGPTLAVDGDVPQPLGAWPVPAVVAVATAAAAAATAVGHAAVGGRWRGCVVLPRGIGVVAQLVHPLNELTLLVKGILQKCQDKAPKSLPAHFM